MAKAASARYNKSCNIECRLCAVVVRVVAGFWSDAQQTDDAQLVFKFHHKGRRLVVVVGWKASWRRDSCERCLYDVDTQNSSSLVGSKGMICTAAVHVRLVVRRTRK